MTSVFQFREEQTRFSQIQYEAELSSAAQYSHIDTLFTDMQDWRSVGGVKQRGFNAWIFVQRLKVKKKKRKSYIPFMWFSKNSTFHWKDAKSANWVKTQSIWWKALRLVTRIPNNPMILFCFGFTSTCCSLSRDCQSRSVIGCRCSTADYTSPSEGRHDL